MNTAVKPQGIYRAAWADFVTSFTRTDLWLWLSWQDIRLRYRRSILGPWWLTLSMFIIVGSIGFAFANIFNMTLENYLPFFAVGQVFWLFFSTQLNESVYGFLNFQHVLQHQNLPLPAFILRQMMRNLIILAHHMVIAILAIVIFRDIAWDKLIFFIPSLLIVATLLYVTSLVIAMLCTRFRDFGPVVTNVVQFMFLITPILWNPALLKNHQWIVQYNLMYHMIEVLRAPLLGYDVSMFSYAYLLSAIVVLSIGVFLIYARFRKRIIHWF
jgi:ABC-type polysaccharide/polyol phosphate export permease